MIFRLSLCFVVIVFIAAVGRVSARPDYELAGITAKAGQKVTGFVAVPPGADGETKIPVTVFHGQAEGPTFVIMAGLHGSEYAPILAVQRLSAQLDAARMRGTVIVINVANLPSFHGRTVYYGPDGKNLNRSFPGRADGTITERIAFTLIEKIIKRGDFLIDVHCGDNNESLRPYVVYYEAELPDQRRVTASRRMADIFGIDFVKTTKLTAFDYATSTYGTRAAFISGLSVLAVEAGQLGRPDPVAVGLIERGLINVLRDLKIIDGKVTMFRKPTRVVRDATVRATKTGLFYSQVQLNQRVRTGQVIGYVTDYFGNRVEEARAPFDGIVMYFTATPPVLAGEPLVNIGEPETRK